MLPHGHQPSMRDPSRKRDVDRALAAHKGEAVDASVPHAIQQIERRQELPQRGMATQFPRGPGAHQAPGRVALQVQERPTQLRKLLQIHGALLHGLGEARPVVALDRHVLVLVLLFCQREAGHQAPVHQT
eukprot:11170787-Lingulodinium_polyedra.AAC.1